MRGLDAPSAVLTGKKKNATLNHDNVRFAARAGFPSGGRRADCIRIGRYSPQVLCTGLGTVRRVCARVEVEVVVVVVVFVE